MSTAPNMNLVQAECCKFHLTNDDLIKVQQILTDQIKKGLSKAGNKAAEVKCYVTYVHDLPNGTERGKYLALDLGGTNFRVLSINLLDQNSEMSVVTYDMPQSLMTGEGKALFDHIAKCLADFIEKENLKGQTLGLGFTFSFPLQQKGLTKGLLVKWTKGFSCPGVVGENVSQLLADAINRRNDLKISVVALLNDTTGTLMSCAYKDPNCRIGLIVGTGCNACYMEKMACVENYEGPKPDKKNHVIINTEFGALGDKGSLSAFRTEYDKECDKESINVASQTFEKLISGMYMGELVRLVMVKLVNNHALLGGKGSEMLNQKGSFKTNFVTAIEEDSPGHYEKCIRCLNEIGITHATNEDCRCVRMICEAVSSRAAFLCAAALSALLCKINEKNVTIGIDGSVYRFHPTFKSNLEKKIRELTTPSISFQLMLSEDGSGRGAALVAAVVNNN